MMQAWSNYLDALPAGDRHQALCVPYPIAILASQPASADLPIPDFYV